MGFLRQFSITIGLYYVLVWSGALNYTWENHIFPYSLMLFEQNKLPDVITCMGINFLNGLRLKEITQPNNELQQAWHQKFVDDTLKLPIAINTPEANEQHYEVDSRFYHHVLGPNRKYSCALYEPLPHTKQEAADRLGEAELRMFETYAERNNLKTGDKLRILDLGCGWGSLSLWLAKRFPDCEVVGVSNSNGQREYIMKLAKERGLGNLKIYTGDINNFQFNEAEGLFDRVFSIEMFEHMKNYELLLQKVSAWMKPQATLFVHIFVHKSIPYHFEVKSEDDWMAKYFFTGGTMPSTQLLMYYQKHLVMEKQWHVNGMHYYWTSYAWLQNLDNKEAIVRPILADSYGKNTDTLWLARWRGFFLACAELFGTASGNEWFVAHYRFVKN